MPKSPATAESAETMCSACGAPIKAPRSAKRRKVQCPSCREVVYIEPAIKPAEQPELASVAASSAPPVSAPVPALVSATSSEDRNRIEMLEARVEALEAALRDLIATTRSTIGGEPARKLVWLSSEPGSAPRFSPEQGKALFHNLEGVRTKEITIRTPAGDGAARANAEWFKSIFDRAGWNVRGPMEVAPQSARGLSLAVPDLPVAKDAAAIYMALKAAGFEAETVLDSELGRDPAAVALTLPAVRAA